VSRWNEDGDLVGEVLFNCPKCGAKLRANKNTLEGNCNCCVCKTRIIIRSAPNLVGPGVYPSQNTPVVALSGQSGKGGGHPGRLETALTRLVNGLVAKGFTFVTLEVSPQQMQERLAKFDEGRLWLSGKIFGFLISGADMPGLIKTITKHVVAF